MTFIVVYNDHGAEQAVSCAAPMVYGVNRNVALVWALLLFVVPAGARAASLSDGMSLHIAQDAVVLVDPTGALQIEDVIGDAHHRFAPASSLPALPEGSAPRFYWFELHLSRAASTTPWALRWSYKITSVDLFVPDAHGYAHVAGGFDLARADAALAPGVLILPESALHGQPVYVRVGSVIDPRSIVIAPLRGPVTASLQRRGVFGFFVGFFVAIGAFNLLMFFCLRERAPINYAGVMFLDACRAAVSFGVFWQVLPPISFLQRELIFDTVALSSLVALAAFSIAFLRLSERDRFARAVVWIGAAIQLSVYLTDFFPNATVAFDWTFIVSLAFYATLLFAGIRASRLGVRVARIFTAGIACSAVGYAINMSSYLLPRQDLWVYALEVGAALQAVLLGMAVAESVQESRAEHEALLMESRHLAQLAMRDGLTGVLNRRSFDDALDDTASMSVADGKPLGVLIVDIDHFKQYNDTLGHQAGDDALRLVSHACASCVRSDDVFARYGGEEFAAIVPDAQFDELQAIADRMRAAVASLGLAHPDGRPLTISVGGASAALAAREAARDVVRDADAALYAAKARGRNVTVLERA